MKFALTPLIAVVLVVQASAQDPKVTACKSNLKNCATALEMYASDHKGAYPQKLSDLRPGYLKSLPTCPQAQRDTYSASYSSRGNDYQLYCSGSNHTVSGLAPNNPAYDSAQGLKVANSTRAGGFRVSFADSAGGLTCEVPQGWNKISENSQGMQLTHVATGSGMILGIGGGSGSVDQEIQQMGSQGKVTRLQDFSVAGLSGKIGNFELTGRGWTRFFLAKRQNMKFNFILLCKSPQTLQSLQSDFDKTIASIQSSH